MQLWSGSPNTQKPHQCGRGRGHSSCSGSTGTRPPCQHRLWPSSRSHHPRGVLPSPPWLHRRSWSQPPALLRRCRESKGWSWHRTNRGRAWTGLSRRTRTHPWQNDAARFIQACLLHSQILRVVLGHLIWRLEWCVLFLLVTGWTWNKTRDAGVREACSMIKSKAWQPVCTAAKNCCEPHQGCGTARGWHSLEVAPVNGLGGQGDVVAAVSHCWRLQATAGRGQWRRWHHLVASGGNGRQHSRLQCTYAS